MPVSIGWDNPEKTIIYARYQRWTWDDFYEALTACTELSHTVDHQVDIICDLVDNVVPKGGTFTHAAAALRHDNERVDLIILVTNNRFIQSLTDMTFRIVPGLREKYRIVPSIDAARELIRKKDQQRASSTP